MTVTWWLRRKRFNNVFFILLKEAFLPSLKIKQFVVFVSFSLFFFGGKHHYSDRHKNIGQLSSLWSVVLSHQVFPSKFLFNSFRFIFLFRIQTIKFGQDGIRSAEFWCRPLHPLCPNHSHKVSRKILEKQSTWVAVASHMTNWANLRALFQLSKATHSLNYQYLTRSYFVSVTNFVQWDGYRWSNGLQLTTVPACSKHT